MEMLAVETTTKLKATVMRQFFTCGARGGPQKETETGLMPESWDTRSLSAICSMMSGGTPPKSNPVFWKGAFPWVSGKDLKANRLADSADHITEEAAQEYSKIAPAGSVLVLVRGMGLANGFALSLIERPMAFNQDLKALAPRGDVTGSFLMHSLTYGGVRMLQNVTNAAHGTKRLTQDDLDRFLIPIPGPEEQAEIVAILDAIDRKIDLHKRKKTVLDDLFKTLLNGLMTGDVQVFDLDLSALGEAEISGRSSSDSAPGGTKSAQRGKVAVE